MALPPEHIRIKRRREEEPVETLYIRSDLHQSKRRFTDFVFQRVVPSAVAGDKDKTIATGGGADAGPTPSSLAPGGGGGLKSPRSVSSGPSLASGMVVSRGVPVVRATAPGEEFADARRRQAAALPVAQKEPKAPVSTISDRAVSLSAKGASGPGRTTLRRFHISAPTVAPGAADDVESAPESRFLHKVSAGVQKRKSALKAVVVEKLAHHHHTGASRPGSRSSSRTRDSRTANVLDELAAKISGVTVSGKMEDVDVIVTTTPRKRHVINDAERRWKADPSTHKFSERLTHAAEGKGRTAQSAHDDPTLWDHGSDELARELELIALQMTGGAAAGSSSSAAAAAVEPVSQLKSVEEEMELVSPKPVLKYQPRPPTEQRERKVHHDRGESMHIDQPIAGDMKPATATTTTTTSVPDTDMTGVTSPHTAPKPLVPAEDADSDTDSDYVYDEFIRRRVHEVEADPRVIQLLNGEWVSEKEAAPRDIGIVVITEEDVHYWDAIAEADDENKKEWDDEDEDSNAEDNPANEYPDEDLDFDDEYDDTNAAYRQYRQNASDDEEFDVNDFDDDACGYGYGYRGYKAFSDNEE
ncbi:hypothetical protein AJ80_01475 [Polytolypa hystricis UAMH7299]|uniref:Transcription factor Iwr1 domain-containing protein n=1 Tax=Polytolypa hystricis (strain UAMH7299) TaxID=1447883 RepID=A0A2B7Z0Z1_POLH7|nr:hypothetical protein AJ80_01475 [Polytolypa hystricis UAMH7299]